MEETPILESRKDGKGTAHHSAISSPTSSHESLKIALEDHCIKCARITWFDPKQGVWSDMTKAHDKMTTATPSKLSHWAVRVAYGACGWAFLFAALSFYWALGGTAGADTVSPEIVQLARAHVPWVMAVLWITAILKVVSGFVALALIQPWGRMVPRWALLILGWGTGTLLFVHGGLYFAVGVLALSGAISVSTPETLLHWYTFLWGPWWLIGGILFLIAAWIYFRRSPHWRVSLAFSALGVFGALVLLVLSDGTIG